MKEGLGLSFRPSLATCAMKGFQKHAVWPWHGRLHYGKAGRVGIAYDVTYNTSLHVATLDIEPGHTRRMHCFHDEVVDIGGKRMRTRRCLFRHGCFS